MDLLLGAFCKANERTQRIGRVTRGQRGEPPALGIVAEPELVSVLVVEEAHVDGLGTLHGLVKAFKVLGPVDEHDVVGVTKGLGVLGEDDGTTKEAVGLAFNHGLLPQVTGAISITTNGGDLGVHVVIGKPNGILVSPATGAHLEDVFLDHGISGLATFLGNGNERRAVDYALEFSNTATIDLFIEQVVSEGFLKTLSQKSCEGHGGVSEDFVGGIGSTEQCVSREIDLLKLHAGSGTSSGFFLTADSQATSNGGAVVLVYAGIYLDRRGGHGQLGGKHGRGINLGVDLHEAGSHSLGNEEATMGIILDGVLIGTSSSKVIETFVTLSTLLEVLNSEQEFTMVCEALVGILFPFGFTDLHTGTGLGYGLAGSHGIQLLGFRIEAGAEFVGTFLLGFEGLDLGQIGLDLVEFLVSELTAFGFGRSTDGRSSIDQRGDFLLEHDIVLKQRGEGL